MSGNADLVTRGSESPENCPTLAPPTSSHLFLPLFHGSGAELSPNVDSERVLRGSAIVRLSLHHTSLKKSFILQRRKEIKASYS